MGLAHVHLGLLLLLYLVLSTQVFDIIMGEWQETLVKQKQNRPSLPPSGGCGLLTELCSAEQHGAARALPAFLSCSFKILILLRKGRNQAAPAAPRPGMAAELLK